MLVDRDELLVEGSDLLEFFNGGVSFDTVGAVRDKENIPLYITFGRVNAVE